MTPATTSLPPVVPYGTSLLMDNKGLYTANTARWDRWLLDRSTPAGHRQWMEEVTEASADDRVELHNGQYRDYIKQRQHFDTHRPTPSPSSSLVPSPRTPPLTLTNPFTTYASYGSHASLPSSTSTPPPPPPNGNLTSFLITSKRIGLDPTIRYSAAQSEAAAQFSQGAATAAQLTSAQAQGTAVKTSSAYALGYGHTHQHHRTYLNEEKEAGRMVGGGEGGKGKGEGGEAGVVQGGRIAQGLGYAEKHPQYYRYLGRKTRRER